MKAQLVALDLDGTVLHHDGHLSPRVRDAVAGVVARGVHVVVATGRSVPGALPVLDRLGLVEGWAVTSNGAVTARLDPALPAGYEVTEAVTFDPAPVLRLLRAHLPTALYAVEDAEGGARLTAPFPPGELNSRVILTDFEDLLSRPATRVIVRSPDHTSEEFVALAAGLGLHEVNYAVGWEAWLDLAPKGVSKATALEAVRQRLGIDPADTLAIGDGRNDLEMLAWAGHAVAMGQAPAEVCAAADEVAPPVAQDGAAVVLERLLRA